MSLVSTMTLAFAGVMGLIVGSFLGALSYRYTRGISIAKGRSFCPRCKKPIVWYDNIPVASWILLGGRCRHCHKKISVRYPLIELGTALTFLAVSFWAKDFGVLPLVYILVISGIMILVFVVDWEHQIIPDEYVFLGVLISVFYLLITDNQDIFLRLLAGFGVALLLLTINFLTKGRGMGLGDVKLAILGGVALDPTASPLWIFLAFLTGGIYGIILILARKASYGAKVAFGPFMVIGFFITLIYGEKILLWLN